MQINVPFYNVLNMLLTGLVFLGVCALMFPDSGEKFLANDWLTKLSVGPEIVLSMCCLAAAYETGLLINRLGSVILSKAFIFLKIIPYDKDYRKFNERKKDFPILDTLSREYAVSRTRVALFLILAVVGWVEKGTGPGVIFLAIAGIYCLSWRKHATKICELLQDEVKNKKRKAG